MRLALQGLQDLAGLFRVQYRKMRIDRKRLFQIFTRLSFIAQLEGDHPGVEEFQCVFGPKLEASCEYFWASLKFPVL